jgi:hypothetical protein
MTREQFIERVKAIADEGHESGPELDKPMSVLWTLLGAMNLGVEDVLSEECVRFAKRATYAMEKLGLAKATTPNT